MSFLPGARCALDGADPIDEDDLAAAAACAEAPPEADVRALRAAVAAVGAHALPGASNEGLAAKLDELACAMRAFLVSPST